MFGILGGDVVGMTGVPEVVLAREIGVCYANISIVTNFGAGLLPSVLTHTEVLEIMAKHTEKVRKLIVHALQTMNTETTCSCGKRWEDFNELSDPGVE